MSYESVGPEEAAPLVMMTSGVPGGAPPPINGLLVCGGPEWEALGDETLLFWGVGAPREWGKDPPGQVPMSMWVSTRGRAPLFIITREAVEWVYPPTAWTQPGRPRLLNQHGNGGDGGDGFAAVLRELVQQEQREVAQHVPYRCEINKRPSEGNP